MSLVLVWVSAGVAAAGTTNYVSVAGMNFNITSDPQLSDPAALNYRLKSTSPLH